ncbi:hypothetical protein D9M69_368450 [compost metagenome]
MVGDTGVVAADRDGRDLAAGPHRVDIDAFVADAPTGDRLQTRQLCQQCCRDPGMSDDPAIGIGQQLHQLPLVEVAIALTVGQLGHLHLTAIALQVGEALSVEEALGHQHLARELFTHDVPHLSACGVTFSRQAAARPPGFADRGSGVSGKNGGSLDDRARGQRSQDQHRGATQGPAEAIALQFAKVAV